MSTGLLKWGIFGLNWKTVNNLLKQTSLFFVGFATLRHHSE